MTDLFTLRLLLDKAGIQYSCWPYPDNDTIMMEVEPTENSEYPSDLSSGIWFEFTKDGVLKGCGCFITPPMA